METGKTNHDINIVIGRKSLEQVKNMKYVYLRIILDSGEDKMK